MRYRRKWVSTVISIICMALFTTGSNADGSLTTNESNGGFFSGSSDPNNSTIAYKVDSLGCTIYCPSDLYVVYKGMTKEQIDAIGTTQEVVDEVLTSEGIDFYAFNEENSFALRAYQYVAPLNVRLAEKNDVFLEGFIGTYIPSVEKNNGISVTASDIVRTASNVYIRYEFSVDNNGEKIYVIVYFTTSDGIASEFWFSCFGLMEEKEDKMIRTIMDQIVWDDGTIANKTPSLAESLAPGTSAGISESSRYHFADTGISFMIPESWEEQPLSKEREILKMKMKPLDDASSITSIIFGCSDAWEYLSETDRKNMGYNSRKDIDEDMMQRDSLAEALGVSASEVIINTYGKYKFGICAVPQELLGVEYDLITAVTCVNGYMIQFQIASFSNIYYPAFVAVLESLTVE